MTDYKALADRLVEILGGYEYEGYYTIPAIGGLFKPETLCHDWRVAGAMLTLVYEAYASIEDVIKTFEGDPLAIIKDCAEALSDG